MYFCSTLRSSTSIVALSEVLPFFRRPVANETSFYGDPLDVPVSRFVEPARADLISEIISGYYIRGRAILSPDSGEPDEIENAVLAVWSQQWPRLRSSFSFCTASLNESRRTEQSDYSVQVAPLNFPSPVGRERWVSIAADDAAQNKVTPLRRFLWRYGRDISASRRQYSMIVDLFARFEGANEISADAALNVFRALPDRSEGAVLKRDILGIGPFSPRLVAAISAVDLLHLLTSDALPEPLTTAQVGERLEEVSSRDIGTVARYYAANREALSPWKEQLDGAIIARADKSSLTRDYPIDIVADVLLAREDLVDSDTLALVKNDVLPQLIKDDSAKSLAHVVTNEMLRRDMGALEGPIISSLPEFVFLSAIEAYCENRIHQSWLASLSHHAGTIVKGTWLSRLRSTKSFAAALSVLGYPRNLAKGSAEIAQRLSDMVDDAQGDERTIMQATLLRTAIDEGSSQSWNLIVLVLPELRVIILRGDLPQIAKSMLNHDLPHFKSAAYWDLDKRILLSLSKLYAASPNNEELHRLALGPAELELVLHKKERPAKHPFAKFWPWLS